MARLYWRVKKEGKWTWAPALVTDQDDERVEVAKLHVIKEEEE